MTTDKDNNRLMRATLQGTVWAYAATYSGKLLVFISTTILARLLLKDDFGLAAYALIFISFLDVLNDLGIGAAVIYHRDEPEVVDTAFWLNMATGITLYGITWLAAPLAGLFFNDPLSVPLTRVLALTFPLTALGNIHSSLLRKNLTFRRKFVPDVVKALGKGIISIILAWAGMGAWSLVLGQVGGTGLAALAYWWAMPYRPRLRLKRTMARPLITYGSNIVAVDGLGTLINQADYLLVGRFLGAASLGVYTLAFRIPELLVKQFCGIVGQVIFPAYTQMKDDPQALSRGLLVTMRYMTMLTVPISLGLAAISRPLVLTAFSTKWIEAVPVMAAIAIYTLIRSLTFNVGAVYKAQGRPEILTWLSLVQLPVLLPSLYWAIKGPGTITAVAWTQVANALISGAANLIVAARLLKIPLRSILAVFGPSVASGTVMALIVWASVDALKSSPPLLQLLVGVLVGAITYSGAMWVLQRDYVLQARASLQLAFGRG